MWFFWEARAALAAAQTPPREPASRAQLEQRLGEALLFACSQARAAPAELIALVPLARVGGESLAFRAGVVGESERAGARDGDAHEGAHGEDGRAVGRWPRRRLERAAPRRRRRCERATGRKRVDRMSPS